MNGLEEHLETVRSYGLTQYQARVYLALLNLKTGTAREISNLSRVPQEKVYGTLTDLHEKKLTEVLPERPKRYVAVPFERYLNEHKKRYEKKLEKLQQDLAIAQDALRPDTPHDPCCPGTFHTIKDRTNITDKIETMLETSRTSLYHLGSAASAQRLHHFQPRLRDLKRHGVDLRILAPLTDANHATLQELAQTADLRTPPRPPPATIVLQDETKALLWHATPDDNHLHQGDDIALCTDDEAIVQTLKHSFQAHWKHAASLSQPGSNHAGEPGT